MEGEKKTMQSSTQTGKLGVASKAVEEVSLFYCVEARVYSMCYEWLQEAVTCTWVQPVE